jgi:hypothetical protein
MQLVIIGGMVGYGFLLVKYYLDDIYMITSFMCPLLRTLLLITSSKKSIKGKLSETQGRFLAELFSKAPEKCLQKIECFWSKDSIGLIEIGMRSNIFEMISSKIPYLTKELRKCVPENASYSE